MRIIIWTFFFSIVSLTICAQTSDILSFSLSGQEIILVGESVDAKIEYSIVKKEESVEIAVIKIANQNSFRPSQISLKWATPSRNVAGYWSTHASLDKTITPDWGPAKVKSTVVREAPVICLFGHDDSNRQTFAISDALNTVTTSTSVKEENGMIYNEVKLFAENHKSLTSFEFKVRIDTRDIHFSKAIADVGEWWTSFDAYTPSVVPEDAKLPVYSSWYSYHQNVSMDALVEECKLARSIGIRSLIVDDGWQTLDSKRGYAYTGDWKPERIPEMKSFVKAVHDLDMKFILWYAVPFVGEKSEAYHKMKGKFLSYWDGQGTYVLDPRYPEVREFIISTYINAIKDWDVDGFKFDFLGRFRTYNDTELTAQDGRDYASVNEATDRLMTDIMNSLKSIKSDILIEFRQPYAGPAMRKYGNMFRATDCPNVPVMNRVGTTDLRLINGNTAVHSDMLMWHHTEAVETAALQLLNILFSVPQISVRLSDIPNDHFEMIRFYTDYWLENRDIFLSQDFSPSSPLHNYPIIKSQNRNKSISVVYDNLVVPIDGNTSFDFDIVNAKHTNKIIVDYTGPSKSCEYITYDCKGVEVNKESVNLKSGVFDFTVPASGLISFIRKN